MHWLKLLTKKRPCHASHQGADTTHEPDSSLYRTRHCSVPSLKAAGDQAPCANLTDLHCPRHAAWGRRPRSYRLQRLRAHRKRLQHGPSVHHVLWRLQHKHRASPAGGGACGTPFHGRRGLDRRCYRRLCALCSGHGLGRRPAAWLRRGVHGRGERLQRAS